MWGILILLLAGCTAAKFSPTPTWPAEAYDTAIAYQSTIISEAYQTATAIRMSHVYVPLVSRSGCQSYQATVEILPDKTSLAVNDTLKVTVVLRNTGCSGLGLPSFQIVPSKVEALIFLSPKTQTHYGALPPGENDTAEFSFTAKTPGQVELVAYATFEVHLDAPPPLNGTPFPTPAGMFKQVLSSPVTITVK